MKDSKVVDSPLRSEQFNREELLQELDNLQPNLQGSALRVFGALIVMLFIFLEFPETFNQPISYIILVFSSLASAEVHSERKRVNKKIKAIHQLIKHDV